MNNTFAIILELLFVLQLSSALHGDVTYSTNTRKDTPQSLISEDNDMIEWNHRHGRSASKTNANQSAKIWRSDSLQSLSSSLISECDNMNIMWADKSLQVIQSTETQTLFNESIYGINHSNYYLVFQLTASDNTIWQAKECLKGLKVPVCCLEKAASLSNCDLELEGLIQSKQNVATVLLKTEKITNMKCNPGELNEVNMDDDTVPLQLKNKSMYVVVSDGYETQNFCLEKADSTENESLLIMACITNPVIEPSCMENCVRKCCPDDNFYDYGTNKCLSPENDLIWTPNFYTDDFKPIEESYTNFSYEFGFPSCKLFYSLNPNVSANQIFYLLTDASLYVSKYGESYQSPQYCIDYFKKGEALTEESLVCFPEVPQNSSIECKHIQKYIYPWLLAISSIFLILTLLVYSLLPELNSKLNGRCVMASTASLLLGYLCQISNEWSSSMSMLACQLLGLTTQFSILVSFFWMNVMCFDVWRALRSTHYVAGISSSTNKRFLKYSIYAFGGPLMISIATAVIQFLPNEMMKENLIVPGFGKTGCFFPWNDPRPWWVYFYSFILIVMLINSVLFVHLLFLLQSDRTNADAALHRRKRKHVMWLKLYVKLFFLMGVTWIFEVISWLEGTCSLWIWIDAINALRGLFIFAIFVCKRNIWTKLRNENVIISSFRSSISSSKPSKKCQSKFYLDINIQKQYP